MQNQAYLKDSTWPLCASGEDSTWPTRFPTGFPKVERVPDSIVHDSRVRDRVPDIDMDPKFSR